MIAKIRHFFVRDPHIRELVAGGVISIMVRIFAAGIAFIVNVAIARYLGIAAAGLFFLALTIITLAVAFSKLGLDSAMTRLVSEFACRDGWGEINAVYRLSVFTIALASSATASAVIMNAAWLSDVIFRESGLAPVLRIMGFSILPTSLYMLHSNCFQGLRDIPRFLVFRNLGVSIVFLTGLLLIFSAETIIPNELLAAEIYVGASVVVAVIAFLSWGILPRTEFFDGNYNKWKVYKLAWPLLGVTGINIVSLWMGQLTLGLWRSTEEVALFNAAARTSMLLQIILMAVNSIAFPKFAAMHSQHDFAAIKNLAIWSTRIMIAVCLPIFVFVLYFSDSIMGIFGPDFVAGSTALIILAAGQFVNVATGSVGGLLTMTGHERHALTSSIVGAVMMTTLCVLLVPNHGVIGASYAQVISLCTQLFVSTWAVKNIFGFVPLNIFDQK